MRRLRTYQQPGCLAAQRSVSQSCSSASSDPGGERSGTPVTLLGGFLGAGKTTLLKHLLEQDMGLRFGVLVNDVAAVNIDSQLVQKSFTSTLPSKTKGNQQIETVELSNGCVCCSIGEELFGTLDMLFERDAKFDHILVELSGVSVPKKVVDNFRNLRRVATGPASRNIAGLPHVVSVVDSSAFCTNWMTKAQLEARPDLLTEDDLHRPGDASIPGIWDCRGPATFRVVQLLAEQIEGAEMVILNKSDIARESELRSVQATIHAINQRAQRVVASFGKVDPIMFLDTIKGTALSPEQLEAISRDLHSKTAEENLAKGGRVRVSMQPKTKNKIADDYGISSFVFEARRPFKLQRLLRFIQDSPLPSVTKLELQQISAQAMLQVEAKEGYENAVAETWGLLRSKGFCWIDQRPEDVMVWSFAGRTFSMEVDGRWWGTLPPDAVQEALRIASIEGSQEAMMHEMEFEFKDQKQQLVFIGQGMDEPDIRRKLEACLLDDEELDEYRIQVKEMNAAA